MLGVEVGSCLKFYWYEEGYVRTASEKFTTKKVSKGVHLTNDAVQKHLPNYDKFEPANKLSYNELDRYCLNNTTFNFYQEILPEMKKVARDICHAVGDRRLIGAGKGFNFEIFGLDFLVDAMGKPWLCEVNTNPSLEICSSLLSRIIPELVENTFRLVVDIFLPPRKTPEYAQSFLTNNKYSLLYSSPAPSYP
jgi:tubulin polyglutamylase TTLL1/tubulin monoglycylase TTLL3/8